MAVLFCSEEVFPPHRNLGVVQLADAVDAVEGASLGFADRLHDVLLLRHSLADDVGHHPPRLDRRRYDLHARVGTRPGLLLYNSYSLVRSG